jgi:hypothetical protein
MIQQTKKQLQKAIKLWGDELAQGDDSGKYVLVRKSTATELDILMRLLIKDASSERTGPKRIDLPEWTILRQELLRMSERKLAKLHRCSRETIRNRIREGLVKELLGEKKTKNS